METVTMRSPVEGFPRDLIAPALRHAANTIKNNPRDTPRFQSVTQGNLVMFVLNELALVLAGAKILATAQTITIPYRAVPYGPEGVPEAQATAEYLKSAASHIRGGYVVGGSNVTATVVTVLNDIAAVFEEEGRTSPADAVEVTLTEETPTTALLTAMGHVDVAGEDMEAAVNLATSYILRSREMHAQEITRLERQVSRLTKELDEAAPPF